MLTYFNSENHHHHFWITIEVFSWRAGYSLNCYKLLKHMQTASYCVIIYTVQQMLHNLWWPSVYVPKMTLYFSSQKSRHLRAFILEFVSIGYALFWVIVIYHPHHPPTLMSAVKHTFFKGCGFRRSRVLCRYNNAISPSPWANTNTLFCRDEWLNLC